MNCKKDVFVFLLLNFFTDIFEPLILILAFDYALLLIFEEISKLLARFLIYMLAKPFLKFLSYLLLANLFKHS